MFRALQPYILKDLAKKYVMLMGPRQCGKTTLAKQLMTHYEYLNYDSAEDRQVLFDKSWDRSQPLVIFDEIHKQKSWKRWLKGVYDTEGIPPQVLITGSARLDLNHKVGDSMAGRYFEYRLHPLDLSEICKVDPKAQPQKVFETLWHCSGFPEPFIQADETYYRRWRRTHQDIILRQDMLDLVAIRDITSLENLIILLKQRVGSSVSYQNLARDLSCDAGTVKRWLTLLESLYLIFRVTPYHKNITRSLLKEPKFYFYDHVMANPESGARLENIVAGSLIKACHWFEDITGYQAKLYYLRTKDGVELDFVVVIDDIPSLMIEVKTKDDDPAKGFNHFRKFMPEAAAVQLVKDLKREKTYPDGLEVRSLIPWLAAIDLANYTTK